jgi:hypothetical protein
MPFTRRHVILTSLLAASALGSNCPTPSPPLPDPCAACRDDSLAVVSNDSGIADATSDPGRVQGCYSDEDTPVMCVAVCETTADCATASGGGPGHACIDNAGGTLCDPYCQASLCGANGECTSMCGTCETVECGVDVSCSAASAYCSVGQHTCFAETGGCSSDSDCPALNDFLIPSSSNVCEGGSLATYGGIACVSGLCRWQFTPIQLVVPGASTIEVLIPSIGTTFSDQSQIKFAWAAPNDSVIVYVLDAIPEDWADLQKSEIWGYEAQMGSSNSVTWSMGSTISGGQWNNGPPIVPTNMALYVLVEEVGSGETTGVSDLVPFVVGDGWPEVNSPCSPLAAVPDNCDNPSRQPQLCYDGSCRALCASDADCGGGGGTCGSAIWNPVVGGTIRYCQ